jgi:hypothetical protein
MGTRGSNVSRGGFPVSESNFGTKAGRDGISRRGALAAAAIGGVGLTGLGLTRRPGRASAQVAVGSGGGIAGGGLIEGPDAAVHFSLFATRLPLGTDGALIVSGKVQLADPLLNWRMESTEVTEYGPVEGEDENLRELRGTMRVTTTDGEDEYPFVLCAVDAGRPADGQDTLELSVGAAVEGAEGGVDAYAFELKGTVSAGDIELVEITLTAAEQES